MLVERTSVHIRSQAETVPFMIESSENYGYILRLFVGGNAIATENTLLRLHQLLERAIASPYTLKVIDIFQHPEEAEADQVSAIPTLLKVWPRPVRRIVGDFDDVEAILRVLGFLES